MKSLSFLIVGLGLILTAASTATTIYVPADQATIQAGINAAFSGDTVLVSPGTYIENLTIATSILLLSEQGDSVTIVRPADSTQSVLYAVSATVTVQGFTFRDCWAPKAVFFDQCHVVLTGNTVCFNTSADAPVFVSGRYPDEVGNCVATNCVVHDNQGGIFTAGLCLIDLVEPGRVSHCTFYNNYGANGGGITLWNVQNALIERCLIRNNVVERYGGGIAMVNGSNYDTLRNNTIAHNWSTSSSGGGVFGMGYESDFRNNIISDNRGIGVVGYPDGGPTWAYWYNDLWQNTPSNAEPPLGTTNVSIDPMFVDTLAGDYRLKAQSFCIDAGDPNPIYNDPDGSRNDMGRYFYENDPPQNFNLLVPANQIDSSVLELAPTFSWEESLDPDIKDVITYSFVISIDSQFVFAVERTGIAQTEYTLDFDLVWNTRYWWKVKATDEGGITVWSNSVFTFRTSTLGDINDDGAIDVVDAISLINYIFIDGPAPRALRLADSNCDGRVNIGDVVYLIRYIFSGGPAPCANPE